jgi:hypothetical protein
LISNEYQNLLARKTQKNTPHSPLYIYIYIYICGYESHNVKSVQGIQVFDFLVHEFKSTRPFIFQTALHLMLRCERIRDISSEMYREHLFWTTAKRSVLLLSILSYRYNCTNILELKHTATHAFCCSIDIHSTRIKKLISNEQQNLLARKTQKNSPHSPLHIYIYADMNLIMWNISLIKLIVSSERLLWSYSPLRRHYLIFLCLPCGPLILTSIVSWDHPSQWRQGCWKGYNK